MLIFAALHATPPLGLQARLLRAQLHDLLHVWLDTARCSVTRVALLAAEPRDMDDVGSDEHSHHTLAVVSVARTAAGVCKAPAKEAGAKGNALGELDRGGQRNRTSANSATEEDAWSVQSFVSRYVRDDAVGNCHVAFDN